MLERIPADAHPMDVLRTGCSMLGNLEGEADFDMQQQVTDRMLACFPASFATGIASLMTASKST